MKARLVKIIKTEAQNERIEKLLLSDWVSGVKAYPALENGNLLLKINDERGREYFKELSNEGELLFTKLYM